MQFNILRLLRSGATQAIAAFGSSYSWSESNMTEPHEAVMLFACLRRQQWLTTLTFM
ncbi:MAG: hypothetical protein JWQ69_3274 [Pseudomonas sp.]|nr:hypothetical protein [Pseudomonas sp.]